VEPGCGGKTSLSPDARGLLDIQETSKSSQAAKRGLIRPAVLLRLWVVELQEVEELADPVVELGRMPHSCASV
jgi:hypothetical protein